jgi:hypothetical protein
MESNLLKEAIADAKAVRQTALANAKVALEEAFSERYQQMFAEKLKEDAEQGITTVDADKTEEEGKGSGEENISEQEIDELIKELESEVGGEPTPSEPGSEPAGELGGETPPAPGAVPPTGAPQMVMCPVGTVATADMAPAPTGLDGAPGAVPPAVPGAVPPTVPPMGMGAEPTAPAAPGAVPPTPPSSVPGAGDEEDEDVNLDELLQSLKEEVESKEEEEEEEGKQIDEDTKLKSSGIGGDKAGGSDNKSPTSGAKSSSKIESGGMKQEGIPSPDSTKVGPDDATKAPRPNQGKNATSTNLSTPSKSGESGPALKANRPNKGDHATASDLSTPGGILKENEDLKKKLNESEETIKYIKGQLNEINLLNAKLLYTNKLFKEYSMNNEQKMRIVEMFDLSKNVREVKLTYANIAESLNFSGNDMKRKAKPSVNVQSITEGLASQPVGTTKPSKSIISEGKVSQMVTRFQKIAGIQPTKK